MRFPILQLNETGRKLLFRDKKLKVMLPPYLQCIAKHIWRVLSKIDDPIQYLNCVKCLMKRKKKWKKLWIVNRSKEVICKAHC